MAIEKLGADRHRWARRGPEGVSLSPRLICPASGSLHLIPTSLLLVTGQRSEGTYHLPTSYHSSRTEDYEFRENNSMQMLQNFGSIEIGLSKVSTYHSE
ncbi:hypothetical protein GE061_002543 [Apolygus lucorum]|uniref:Uncharacterized protein n=1 Tax=Apolygus lucorum TaxID=248454 RepID=A0A6A4J6H1_APOLU|nr:hypothetical protein GE061_002543 [Apolygus lucorum]